MADGLFSINRKALIEFLDGNPKGKGQEGLGSQQAAFNNLIGEELALSVYQDYIKKSLNKIGVVVHRKIFVLNPEDTSKHKWLDGCVTERSEQDEKVNEIIEVKSWASSNYEGENKEGIPLDGEPVSKLKTRSIENARRSLCKRSMGFENIEKILYGIDVKNKGHEGLNFGNNNNDCKKYDDSITRTVVFWQPIYLPKGLQLQKVFDRDFGQQNDIAAAPLSIIDIDFRNEQRSKFRNKTGDDDIYSAVYARSYQIFSVSNYLRTLDVEEIEVRAPLYKGMTKVLERIIPKKKGVVRKR